MTATFIHTQRKSALSGIASRFATYFYFLCLAASLVYLWFLTQNQFTSEGSFKISRNSGGGIDSGLSQLVLPGLTDPASADAQIVIGYINSADLLLELEKEFDLINHYSSPRSDIVFRLERDDSLEDRLVFYRSHISAHFSMEAGLTLVHVATFDPELSKKIAAKVLMKAESFVNHVNQHVADQQLDFIRSELARNVARVNEVNEEIVALQNRHGFIDPDQSIGVSMTAVQGLQGRRIDKESELATLRRDSPESPRIDTLHSQIRSINELIAAEMAKLSGPEQDRMNQILIEFRELQQKFALATQLRTSAEVLLERNRIEAIARSRFFSVIQSPYLPEEESFPKRPYATATLLVLGLLVYLILRAIARSVLENA